MKISDARMLARLLGVLHKLKLVNAQLCDKLIDQMTVSVLRDELSKRYPAEYLKEDLYGKSDTSK